MVARDVFRSSLDASRVGVLLDGARTGDWDDYPGNTPSTTKAISRSFYIPEVTTPSLSTATAKAVESKAAAAATTEKRMVDKLELEIWWRAMMTKISWESIFSPFEISGARVSRHWRLLWGCRTGFFFFGWLLSEIVGSGDGVDTLSVSCPPAAASEPVSGSSVWELLERLW